jgi:hypothetical protein
MGRYPACKVWASAPVATNLCRPVRTSLGAFGVQPARGSHGVLDNVFLRPAVHIPRLVLAGRSKAWSAGTSMSLIAPESGRMLFCALTACAAVSQVSSTCTCKAYLQLKQSCVFSFLSFSLFFFFFLGWNCIFLFKFKPMGVS